MESSTWPLNSHNCTENYTKTKTKKNIWIDQFLDYCRSLTYVLYLSSDCTYYPSTHIKCMRPALLCSLISCFCHAAQFNWCIYIYRKVTTDVRAPKHGNVRTKGSTRRSFIQCAFGWSPDNTSSAWAAYVRLQICVGCGDLFKYDSIGE